MRFYTPTELSGLRVLKRPLLRAAYYYYKLRQEYGHCYVRPTTITTYKIFQVGIKPTSTFLFFKTRASSTRRPSICVSRRVRNCPDVSQVCPSTSVFRTCIYWVTHQFQGQVSRQDSRYRPLPAFPARACATLQFAEELFVDLGEPARTYVYVELSTANSVSRYIAKIADPSSSSLVPVLHKWWTQYKFCGRALICWW